VSRIEQALEKAVRMRESKKELASEESAVSVNQVVLHKFEVGKRVIDPAAVDKHLICITEPYSLAAEQYKRLKARILRATANEFHNTIMVTSADVEEGKSLTSANLAVVLSSEIDYTVLLVDADLRRPSIHKYFGIEQRKGLSNYLKGEVSLSDVLVKTGIGKLVLLPSGDVQENAAELLSSERMKLLVKELKARYKDRYIIFDSPPLLVTADPISIGGLMDNVLFVIQEGRTSQKAVSQAFSLTKGWNILGAVFNNVPEDLMKNKYLHYYSYGNQSGVRSESITKNV
jgi:exopolysaccharide/PEP-CTERM locus tyrosine autokinase